MTGHTQQAWFSGNMPQFAGGNKSIFGFVTHDALIAMEDKYHLDPKDLIFKRLEVS